MKGLVALLLLGTVAGTTFTHRRADELRGELSMLELQGATGATGATGPTEKVRGREENDAFTEVFEMEPHGGDPGSPGSVLEGPPGGGGGAGKGGDTPGRAVGGRSRHTLDYLPDEWDMGLFRSSHGTGGSASPGDTPGIQGMGCSGSRGTDPAATSTFGRRLLPPPTATRHGHTALRNLSLYEGLYSRAPPTLRSRPDRGTLRTTRRSNPGASAPPWKLRPGAHSVALSLSITRATEC